MGEPVQDQSPPRLLRSMLRAQGMDRVRRMYGGADHINELVRRIRERAASLPTVEGRVIYDVEPVAFDDLIEIRTGGDRAVMVGLERAGSPFEVSYWPLMTATEDEVLSGWEATLQEAADQPHVVTVEQNSILEQALTFDFGYVAVARDISMLRKLTSPRYAEEIRERARRQAESRGDVVMPRRVSFVNDNATTTMRNVRISNPGFSTPEWQPAITNEELWTINEASMAPSPAYVQRQMDTILRRGSLAVDLPPLDRNVDEDDVIEDWEADHAVIADSGESVDVDADGRDPRGDNPLEPGYRVGFCNCEDCRDTRINEALGDEDYDDHVDPDMDYEEDDR